LLRSSSANNFGRGCRRPRKEEPAAPKDSQCGFALENGLQHPVDHFAALIQRAKLHLAIDGGRFRCGRARGGEIPARISAGEFVAGDRYTPRWRVQILQEGGSGFSLNGILEATRVTAIPVRVEYLSARMEIAFSFGKLVVDG